MDVGIPERPRSVLACLALTLAGFAVATAAILAVAVPLRLAGGADALRGPRMLLLAVVVQGAAFGVTVAVYLLFRERGTEFVRMRAPSIEDLVVALGGFVVLLVALAGASTVIRLLGLETASSRIFELGRSSPGVFLVLALLSFLVIGPAEELLFRGVIQRRLREAFAPVPAIGIASLFFAVPHVFSFSGAGIGVTIAVVLLLGVVLGAFYEYSDNLAVPILMHGGYNALLFVALYVAVSQGIEPGV